MSHNLIRLLDKPGIVASLYKEIYYSILPKKKVSLIPASEFFWRSIEKACSFSIYFWFFRVFFVKINWNSQFAPNWGQTNPVGLNFRYRCFAALVPTPCRYADKGRVVPGGDRLLFLMFRTKKQQTTRIRMGLPQVEQIKAGLSTVGRGLILATSNNCSCRRIRLALPWRKPKSRIRR